jgi:hypothetical protein
MTTSRNQEPPTAVAHTADERLLTIGEAAAIVRAPVATLRYWRHLGTGPRSFRLGRRVLYRHDDLIAWINDQHDSDGPSAA